MGHCYSCYLKYPETQSLVHFVDRIAVSNDCIPDCIKLPPLAGDWLLPSDGCREPIEDCPPCHEWKGEGQEMGAWVQPRVNILPYSPWREQKYDKI